MSWSVSLPKPVKKEDVDGAIDSIVPTSYMDGPMLDQFRTAKQAAKLVAHNIPGPYVSVSMSGHANAVGWQKKEGYANDCIAINVGQITEADLQYYNK